jgi:hypothetical protein
VLGEAALALLREDELPVGEHVELALRALDDLRVVVRPSLDLGRETRGPAVVAASDGAVVDLDAHGGSVPRGIVILWGWLDHVPTRSASLRGTGGSRRRA